MEQGSTLKKLKTESQQNRARPDASNLDDIEDFEDRRASIARQHRATSSTNNRFARNQQQNQRHQSKFASSSPSQQQRQNYPPAASPMPRILIDGTFSVRESPLHYKTFIFL